MAKAPTKPAPEVDTKPPKVDTKPAPEVDKVKPPKVVDKAKSEVAKTIEEEGIGALDPYPTGSPPEPTKPAPPPPEED